VALALTVSFNRLLRNGDIGHLSGTESSTWGICVQCPGAIPVLTRSPNDIPKWESQSGSAQEHLVDLVDKLHSARSVF
jgi:hypothetical protein